MNLMRLAFKADPKSAESIFSSINEQDGKISDLLNSLAKTIKL